MRPAWSADSWKRWAVWLFALVAVLFAWVFEEISDTFTETTAAGGVTPFDRMVLLAHARARRPWLNGIAVDFTALGSSTVLALVTLVAVAVLLFRGDRGRALRLGVISVGAAIATVLLKHALSRPRPDVIPRLVVVSGLSYPSGHSFGATAIYASIGWLVARSTQGRARVAAVVFTCVLVLAIADSRVYLGVHYPTDVLGGIVGAIAWVSAVIAVFGWLDRGSAEGGLDRGAPRP